MNQKLFMMSFRFNKNKPEDFGLISSNDPNVFILPDDGSLWKKHSLYDFGWGEENGYYKLPLPDFDELVDIVLKSNLKENKYGAAAIILEYHGDELLNKCNVILDNKVSAKKYLEFFEILNLSVPINRSTIEKKSCNEIFENYKKWKAVSEQIKELYK